MKVFKWSILAITAFAVAGFAFVYFSPDYAIYSVRTEIMKPAIKMGDMIVTGPLSGFFSGELQSGAVVTYTRNEELTTHRVVSVDGNTLVTKGDAVEESDPWAVAMSDVSGVSLFNIPYGGYLANFIRTRLGWLLVVILPSMLLVGLIIWDIVKEIRAIKTSRAPASTAQETAETPASASREAIVLTPKIGKSAKEIIEASTKEFNEAAESLMREFEESLGWTEKISIHPGLPKLAKES